MKRLNHRGFTLMEAIASFVIVAIVLTTATILIANGHERSVATSRQVDAVMIGSLVRDDIVEAAVYADVDAWLDGAGKTISADSCDDPGSPFSCGFFTHAADGIVYDTEVIVAFDTPTASSILYGVIRFSVVVTYYGDRTVVVEGVICDD
ncbi:MAG: prepilin-type N-terminal cleavage/methylation domain-containing protein [Candidatus Izemoplasmatales bacterium]